MPKPTTIKPKKNEKIKYKALAGHFKRTQKEQHPNVSFVKDDEDQSRWFFKIHDFSGEQDEFKSAEILGEVTATDKYPFSPPNAKIYTPNGVYPINNSDFCVDIGKYHKSNWPATYGMDGFVKMLFSGLIGWKDLGYGINLKTGDKKKDILGDIINASSNSKDYNRKKLPHILEKFSVEEKSDE